MVREKDDDLLKVLPMEMRQHAIAYQFIYIMQGAVPEEWGGADGTINCIMMNLQIPAGSRAAVRAVLESVWACVIAGTVWGPTNNYQGGSVVQVRRRLYASKAYRRQ